MPSTAFDSFYLKDRYGSAAMRAIWEDRAMIQRCPGRRRARSRAGRASNCWTCPP